VAYRPAVVAVDLDRGPERDEVRYLANPFRATEFGNFESTGITGNWTEMWVRASVPWCPAYHVSSVIRGRRWAVRLNSKGQVTIPAALRAKHGLHEGDEVDVVEDGGVLRIVRARDAESRGRRLVRHMRGRGSAADTADMSTDELMDLLRGE
jgi:AbrB family looped-hinge helix DNA binding protein